jgi:hypothetical protein
VTVWVEEPCFCLLLLPPTTAGANLIALYTFRFRHFLTLNILETKLITGLHQFQTHFSPNRRKLMKRLCCSIRPSVRVWLTFIVQLCSTAFLFLSECFLNDGDRSVIDV